MSSASLRVAREAARALFLRVTTTFTDLWNPCSVSQGHVVRRLLSNSFRHGALLSGLGGSLLRRFRQSVFRRFLGSGLLFCSFLGADWLLLRSLGSFERPTAFRSLRNGAPASGTDLPLWLCWFRSGRWFRLLRFRLYCRPSLLLAFCHTATGGGTDLALTCGCFRCDDSLGSATGQHGPEFPNLCIYSSFLRLETFDGGCDDFSVQFWRGHNSFSIPFCWPQGSLYIRPATHPCSCDWTAFSLGPTEPHLTLDIPKTSSA